MAIKEIAETGAKIIIGPMDSSLNSELNNYKDLIFISLSNRNPQISRNVINIGISLESQLKAETNAIGEIAHSTDFQEGIKAFTQKRMPWFQGL